MLASVLTSSSVGCLVLGAPDFQATPQTRPVLISDGTVPDVRSLVQALPGQTIEFRAQVLSEDGGLPVQVALYLDYGVPNDIGFPFQQLASAFEKVPAATLAEGPRPVAVRWTVGQNVAPGCHTITMIAMHELDTSNFCPADLKGDSSQLTWFVETCTAASVSPLSCTPEQAGCAPFACPQPPLASCPSLEEEPP